MSKGLTITAAVAAAVVVVAVAAYALLARRSADPPDLAGFEQHRVTSADGTSISYLSLGDGPGLVVVPGAVAVAADYADLARELAGRFTVHVMDRRGHGDSGPQGAAYDLDREVEDLSAVQVGTGARYVFGHSFGGFVALETALRHSAFTKIALYEPGVSIDGSMSTSWFEPTQRFLAAGDDLDALTEFVRGTSPDAAATPHWILKLILPLVITKDRRQRMYDLLPAAVAEHRVLAGRDNDYPEYAGIAAPLLIMTGAESDASTMPRMSRVAEAMPAVETVTLKGLDHFGPDQTGPALVGQTITGFLLE